MGSLRARHICCLVLITLGRVHATSTHLTCVDTAVGGTCVKQITATGSAVSVTRIRILETVRATLSGCGGTCYSIDTPTTAYASFTLQYCGRTVPWGACAAPATPGACTCFDNIVLAANCTACSSGCSADAAKFLSCDTPSPLEVVMAPGAHHDPAKNLVPGKYLTFSFEVDYTLVALPPCSTHTCSAGFTAKPGATVCWGTCDDATCCDATCDNADITCSTQFVKKASADTIVCGEKAEDCTRTACCEASCATLFCPLHHQRIAMAATIGCTGACAPAQCCEALCTGHTCSVGLKLKDTAGSTACGADVTDCTDATCCDVTCGASFSCPANYIVKVGAENILCGSTAADCSATQCCDAYCSLHACAGTFVDKANKAMTRCGALPADCTDNLCCDVTCATFACGAAYSAKAGADSITCGGTAADCSRDKCCDATCNSFVCGLGHTAKAGTPSIVCGDTALACSLAVCCDVTCTNSGFTCSAGFSRILEASKTVCGTLPTECTDALCCEAVCGNSAFSCSAGHHPKTAASTISCRGSVSSCSDAVCCDVLCDHAAFACGVGFTLKGDAGDRVCGATAGDCSTDTCCDVTCVNPGFRCSAGFTLKATAAGLACGGTAVECSNTLCCDATCGGFACGAGLTLKANATTLPCGSGAICSSTAATLCCDATCDNVGFSCGVGFVIKAAAPSTRCGASVTDCDVATCCEATCSNAGFTCGSNSVPRPSANVTVCGDTPASCTEAMCCTPTCRGYTCPMHFQPIALLSTTCSEACTTAQCCQALCSQYVCSPGHSAVGDNHLTVCGTSAADCTDARCCDPTCDNGAFACPTYFAKKSNAAGIICGASVADCADAMCCDALCTGHVCASGLSHKSSSSAITCGVSTLDCTDAKCCDATCDNTDVTCTGQYVRKRAAKFIVCGPTSATCTPDECCDSLCSGFTCSTGFQHIDGAQHTPCDGPCTQAQCCQALCVQHACSPGYIDSHNKALIVCGASRADCTDARCCDAACDHAGYVCTTYYKKKATAADIACGVFLAQCTNALCCDAACSGHSCGSGYAAKSDNADIICGPLRTDCSDELCCDETTPVPETEAPPVNIPYTPKPSTASPPTDAPPTESPPTDAPPTARPTTDAPPTLQPTAVPPTAAPPTETPRTLAPVATLVIACPASIAAEDVTASKLRVVGLLSNAPLINAVDLHVVSDVKDHLSDEGLEVFSSQPGFVKREESPPLEVHLLLGHDAYHGVVSENITITMTVNNEGPAASCSVFVNVTEETSATKGPQIFHNSVGTSTVASIAAASAVSTLSLIATPTCPVKGKLPLLLHPTQIAVGGNPYAGMILGNLLICLGITLVTHLLSHVVLQYAPSVLPFPRLLSAQGVTRFPSVTLFYFQLLYQGIAYGALHLIFARENSAQFGIGIAVATIFCLAVPVWIVWVIARGVPKKAVYHVDPWLDGKYSRLMLGLGEWVCVDRKNPFNCRFMSMLKPYHQRSTHFTAFTFLLSFAVGGLSVLEVHSFKACGRIKIGMSALFALLSFYIIVTGPYVRRRDTITFAGVYAMCACAIMLQAAAFLSGNRNDSRFDVANDLFTVLLVVFVVKAIVDILCDIYVVMKNRLNRLQAEVWGKDDEVELLTKQAATEPTPEDLSASLSAHTPATEPASPEAVYSEHVQVSARPLTYTPMGRGYTATPRHLPSLVPCDGYGSDTESQPGLPASAGSRSTTRRGYRSIAGTPSSSPKIRSTSIDPADNQIDLRFHESFAKLPALASVTSVPRSFLDRSLPDGAVPPPGGGAPPTPPFRGTPYQSPGTPASYPVTGTRRSTVVSLATEGEVELREVVDEPGTADTPPVGETPPASGTYAVHC